MSRTDRLDRDLERGFLALEDGRLEEAAASVERCQRIDRKNPDVLLLAAAVADARGDVETALAHYRTLVEEDLAAAKKWIGRVTSAEFEADAQHLLGRVHEVADERDAMIACWQKVRALDAAAPAPPLLLPEDELEKIAADTLAELPADV